MACHHTEQRFRARKAWRYSGRDVGCRAASSALLADKALLAARRGMRRRPKAHHEGNHFVMIFMMIPSHTTRGKRPQGQLFPSMPTTFRAAFLCPKPIENSGRGMYRRHPRQAPSRIPSRGGDARAWPCEGNCLCLSRYGPWL